jgi:hypothetical protein
MTSPDLAALVTWFFVRYLAAERHVSPHTGWCRKSGGPSAAGRICRERYEPSGAEETIGRMARRPTARPRNCWE